MTDYETARLAAFETWARGPAGYVDDQLARYADGSYQDSTTRLHWSIFKAGWMMGLACRNGMPRSRTCEHECVEEMLIGERCNKQCALLDVASMDEDLRAKPFPKDSEFKPFRPRPIT